MPPCLNAQTTHWFSRSVFPLWLKHCFSSFLFKVPPPPNTQSTLTGQLTQAWATTTANNNNKTSVLNASLVPSYPLGINYANGGHGDMNKEFNISVPFQLLISPLFPPSSCSHTNRQNVAWHFFNVSISILPLETLKDPQALERRLLTACDGPFIYLCLFPVYILSLSPAHGILWGLSKRWRSEGARADIDLYLYGCCIIHPSYPCFSLLTLTLLLWSLFLLSLFL